MEWRCTNPPKPIKSKLPTSEPGPVERFCRIRARAWFPFAATLALSAVQVLASGGPNVVFILGDDQAWWDYSFMYRAGVEKAAIDLDPSVRQVAQTPALDRLADSGLTFTHGYTTPLCRPSLASIFTGTFPHHHQVTGNDLLGRASDEAVEDRMQVMQCLPRILSVRRGYRSFQTGKWWEGHHGNGGFTAGNTVNSVSLASPDTRPPQWSGGKPSYVTARHGDWGLMIGRVDYRNGVASPAHPINYADTIVPATDFIDAQVAAERPFFLWYAPFLPHTPHDPPAGLRAKYDALVDEPDESGDYLAKYYANVERFDGGVGALLDHLEAAGIADNTIVVMICDNGWINKTTASAFDARSKRSPYEGGVRTPIIVRWPETIRPGGVIEPQVVTTPVSVIDLVPTVLAALGLERSPEMRGINLLDPAAVAARDTVFGEVSDHDMQDFPDPAPSLRHRFARRGGWKLILPESGSAELYHLYEESTGAPVDPYETNNLAAVNPALAGELADAIEAWYEEPKSIAWQSGAAQKIATDLLPAPAELGQTFTTANEEPLVAVRVGLRPTAPSQSITLELRELDGAGAPLGTLLASATVTPGQLVRNETRWYLFELDRPVAATAGTALGFRLVSSDGAGGFEAAYRRPGAYGGGAMYYSGLLDGALWTTGDFDLAFETLGASHGGPSVLRVEGDGAQLRLFGLMSVKQRPALLQRSLDLESWSSQSTVDNLDGLTSWTIPIDQGGEFFRVTLVAAGETLALTPSGPGTLYAEDFSGGGSNLHGVSPDATVAGATWTAPAAGVFLDDGTVPTTGGGTAYLPFTPEHGFVYTLTVEFAQGATDVNSWIAFGFLRDPPGTGAIHTGPGVLWALTRNTTASENQVLHENLGGGTGSVERGNYVSGAASVRMSLVLDTTGGSGAWSYDWLVNGTARVTDRPLSTAFESAIGGVGIGKIASATPNSFRAWSLVRE